MCIRDSLDRQRTRLYIYIHKILLQSSARNRHCKGMTNISFSRNSAQWRTLFKTDTAKNDDLSSSYVMLAYLKGIFLVQLPRTVFSVPRSQPFLSKAKGQTSREEKVKLPEKRTEPTWSLRNVMSPVFITMDLSRHCLKLAWWKIKPKLKQINNKNCEEKVEDRCRIILRQRSFKAQKRSKMTKQ